MKTNIILTTLLTAAMLTGTTSAAEKNQTIQRKQLFNSDWQFVENDSDFTKAKPVTLPHDWSIGHNFDAQAPAGGAGGYLPTGKGWYRRTLTLDKTYDGKKIRLYFEGVYMNSHVYVNGKLAGGWPYGYSSFWVDATPFLNVGDNEIVVSVDNSKQGNCRWYSGSGIYRNVWLVTTDKTYIDDWSIAVSTPDTHHVNISATVVMSDGTTRPLQQTIEVAEPRLWSPDDPYLYTTELSIPEGDRIAVTYGIRTIDYSAEKGFYLNGKPLLLNGACVHHDNGIIGAAAFDDAEYRKAVEIAEERWEDYKARHCEDNGHNNLLDIDALRRELTPEENAEIDLDVAFMKAMINARRENGMTQTKLAELSGIKQPMIARIEGGKTIPRIDTLQKLLSPLGLRLAIVPM